MLKQSMNSAFSGRNLGKNDILMEMIGKSII